MIEEGYMAYGVEIEADDIRGVKTDFLRELIKHTSWSERGRISGLTDLEHKLVCGVQPRWASHVSYGNLLASYPMEYEAMVEELVRCDWLSTKRKDDIQAEYRTRMEREKKQAGESAGREREVRERDREALLAWREAGGLE
jgi:hypothetical protein